MPHKGGSNMNRLAFTANNFYDSRNMLGGVQQYGMRPSADAQNNQSNYITSETNSRLKIS